MAQSTKEKASPKARAKAKEKAKATRAKVSPKGEAKAKERAKSPNTVNISGKTPTRPIESVSFVANLNILAAIAITAFEQ